jgi:hypothetical protein
MKWLVDTSERDAWQLSRDGRKMLENIFSRYRDRKLDVRQCYLWTPKFKKRVDPNYEPSAKDAVRREELLSFLLE